MNELIVDEKLVEKVAKNARINLTKEELKKFTPQIKEVIIDSFNKLDKIDVDEEPAFQPIKQKNKFRKDKVKKSLTQDDALKNVDVKLRDRGYIKGPKVVE